ncbi:MAG: hypothetical protein L7S40_00425 [Rhodobacteraceae bacterium]|nr:hypothetical protein [Paracoccaceae bacterium]
MEKKLEEIVIELSARLADDSDYDSNIKPKCQALLDYLYDQQVQQYPKQTTKGDMIVCFTTDSEIEGVSSDHIHAFREDTKGAFAQYNKLAYNSNDVISASICQVIDSTDYDGMWDSEVGEDNLVDPNMKKYIDHQIEIITDSDWFEELVKDKVKEVSDENN